MQHDKEARGLTTPSFLHMKLLSFDQSTTRTGYAIFINDSLQTYGLIDMSKHKVPEERFQHMCAHIIRFIQETQPDFVVFEDVSMQSNIGTAILLARLQGVIIGTCLDCKILFDFYKPSSWRKVLQFDQGSGIKRDDLKRQAKQYVTQTFHIRATEDQSEAICIGWAHILKKGEYE